MILPRRVQAAAVAVLLSIVSVGAAAAATPTTYHVDLTLYFPSDTAERESRTALFAAARAFDVAPAPADAAALETYFRTAEGLFRGLVRHRQYLELKASMDTTDREASAGDDAVNAEITRVSSRLSATLLGMRPDEFDSAVKTRPSLERYRFKLDSVRRDVDHTLEPELAVVLDTVADPSLSALSDLYQRTLRSTQFAPVQSHAGPLNPWKERKKLLADPDPTVRRNADGAWYAGLASREPIYAGILLDIVATETRVAKLQHFDSAPAAKYFSRDLTVADVKATLAAIKAHADLNRQYQRVRIAHTRVAAGLIEVHSWDLAAPAGGFAPPQFTLDQVRANAHGALKPLGPRYLEQFDALLDPANRRADVGNGGPERDSSGFSLGYPGSPTVLYLGNFQGYLSDANSLIHEAGHATHRALMSNNQVSPFYATGPSWMFEAFAILNEYLQDDYLYRTSTDPRAKAYYLNALVSELTFQVFGSAEEGSLEQAIYDAAAENKIKDGPDLDALTLATLKDFDVWPAEEPDQAHIWMAKSLMYDDPLYLVNYLYAGLLATKLYQMATTDPADFQRRYTILLSHGFVASPDVLLTRFFGRRITTAELIPGAMDVIAAKTEALEAAYRVTDTAK